MPFSSLLLTQYDTSSLLVRLTTQARLSLGTFDDQGQLLRTTTASRQGSYHDFSTLCRRTLDSHVCVEAGRQGGCCPSALVCFLSAASVAAIIKQTHLGSMSVIILSVVLLTNLVHQCCCTAYQTLCAVVMQHIHLVKGSDDPNTYLVNDTADPLQRSLTCLELTDVLMGAPPPGASTTWPPPTGPLVNHHAVLLAKRATETGQNSNRDRQFA